MMAKSAETVIAEISGTTMRDDEEYTTCWKSRTERRARHLVTIPGEANMIQGLRVRGSSRTTSGQMTLDRCPWLTTWGTTGPVTCTTPRRAHRCCCCCGLGESQSVGASGSLGDIGLTAVVVLVVADMGQIVMTPPAVFKGMGRSERGHRA